MYEICCVGHITLDKVVTHKSVVHMPGGTALYFSSAVSHLDLSYLLVTAVGQNDRHLIAELETLGTNVLLLPSANTVFFENIYSEDQDYREQRVLRKADPFTIGQFIDVQARIFHLGPLLADDLPVDVIRLLASRGKVSLDVQGYLRRVEKENVIPVDWPAKKEALQYVHYLKANESEMTVLTGLTNPRKAAKILYDWGVKEVVITQGSKGSLIYDGKNFYEIPAYSPNTFVVDSTGCGDTYMAGYLYQRVKGAGHQTAGEFAAAMATLKIETSGPFTGSEEDVLNLVSFSERRVRIAE